MKAYAILDGGGVKGAALAGCLAAADNHGVEFVAYGGTSAGAVIALLASVGFTGPELRSLLKADGHPQKFLDDGGADLLAIQQYIDHCQEILTARSAWHIKCWRLLFSLPAAPLPLLSRLVRDAGLYKGDKARQVLLDLVARKKPAFANRLDLRFEELAAAGCSPLKIVASDVTHRRAAVFSSNDTEYGSSVFDAVRASMSYPFLFLPPAALNDRRLADGGLSSNLPTFLFAEEYDETGHPILAFELVSESAPRSGPYGGRQFVRDMMSTALEAGDDLFVRFLTGVHRVKVPIPSSIDTLSFHLRDDEIEALYTAGVTATSEYLGSFRPLLYARQAGDKIPRQLWARYGDRKLFEPPLIGLKMMVEGDSRAKEVRAQIMLPTGRPDRSRIVTYSFGFDEASDGDLELDEFGGCTGRAVQTRKPTVADLEDARANFATWGMSSAQQSKVDRTRRSMLSVPIFSWAKDRQNRREESPILGVLSVDSSTPLRDTHWLGEEAAGGSPRVREDVVKILEEWADVVARLLRPGRD